MKEAVKQALQETLQPILTDIRVEATAFITSMNERLETVETAFDDHSPRIASLETTAGVTETRLAALEADTHSHAPTGVPPFAGQPQ